ncbi:hypothetical protein TNCV_1667021 [Trichonephila clavipes]|nr:hypothetical protein TNCV_1667021 [Trichonephila clavipes]
MREDACVRTCQPDYIWSEKLKDGSFADVGGFREVQERGREGVTPDTSRVFSLKIGVEPRLMYVVLKAADNDEFRVPRSDTVTLVTT